MIQFLAVFTSLFTLHLLYSVQIQWPPHYQTRQPTPVLLPGKSHGRGAWQAAVNGVAKSRTRLSDFTFTFHFHTLQKEMAAHSSVLAWRIPGMAEPAGLPSMGSHRVGHDGSDFSSSSSSSSSGSSNSSSTPLPQGLNVCYSLPLRCSPDIHKAFLTLLDGSLFNVSSISGTSPLHIKQHCSFTFFHNLLLVLFFVKQRQQTF